MIEVENITKKYITGETEVVALKGVNLKFRKNEFVSILGPSGCGKTTLLNIIGGLDRYDSGDLKIDSISTKEYKDCDWDTYRNHFVGFIFQSYNLIMHLTVIENVELALSIAGYSKEEKYAKALLALENVGLKEQINKKPNQLSGGQMQRVAIARAIVNNPKIILADEPTGALDTETSVQIMDILKNLSKEVLIIMVTHNENLAKEYSSRIINILDGTITGDSNPLKSEEIEKNYFEEPQKEYIVLENEAKNENTNSEEIITQTKKDKKEKKNKKTSKLKAKSSMSFWTAFMLSLRNLGTKKTRTILTSFAGSIGIIGIALILALSNGFQAYIYKTEADTMSSYPITIQKSSMDLTSILENLYQPTDKDMFVDDQEIYVNEVLSEFLNNYRTTSHTNDLSAFKTYLEANIDRTKVNAIQYGYKNKFNVYKSTYDETQNIQVNPFEVPYYMELKVPALKTLASQLSIWTEMIDNRELLQNQYDLLGNSRWPENHNEVVMIVDEYNQINDFLLYAIGLKDYKDIEKMFQAMIGNLPEGSYDSKNSYSFEEIFNTSFKVVVEGSYYQKNSENIWENKSTDTIFMKDVLDNAIDMNVVGIVRPKPGTAVSSLKGAIGYTKDLTEFMINKNNQTGVVLAQKATPNVNVFTNQPFTSEESFEENIDTLSIGDITNPTKIMIYPAEFEAKAYVTQFIKDYNKQIPASKSIEYTDYVGIILSSVTMIVDSITYVLIAFVSISLVVSSIMIGIITYISVLERTNEIGILRSVGARKKDVKRVFNAEALIIGFISGAMGIIITYVLSIPINIILKSLIDIPNIASLNILPALILIAISMTLTFISGLIPASIAAKKEPVTALRSE